jgi:hypothetical protein
MPNKVLNIYLRILNIIVFRYSVYNELIKILAAYE